MIPPSDQDMWPSSRAREYSLAEDPMDFEYTPEQDAFRKELRGWLAANLPRDLCVDDPADDRVAPDRATFERRCAWQKTMHKAGWVGIAWPKEYGGGGGPLARRAGVGRGEPVRRAPGAARP